MFGSRVWHSVAISGFSVALVGLLASGSAQAEELPSPDEEPIVFGFRGDAPPFSFCRQAEEDCPQGNCAFETEIEDCRYVDGYTARLCQEVRARLGAHEISFRRVGTKEAGGEGRFSLLADSKISILCGATTLSLERMDKYRTSLLVFVSGASAIHRRDVDIDSLDRLEGLKVGVLADTTTFNLLNRLHALLPEESEKFEIVRLDSHAEAPACLSKETLSAICPEGLDVYFADREILLWLVRDASMPGNLKVSERYFSREPYAIYIAPNRPELVYEVNATLLDLFQDRKRLDEILDLSFGTATRSDVLDTLFQVQQMPVD